MNLGERIKIARKKIGLSQLQLAKVCGWRGSMRISHYEKNKREPSTIDLTKIASALKVNPEWLQFGSGMAPSFLDIRNIETPTGHVPVLQWNEIIHSNDWNKLDTTNREIIPMFGNGSKNCFALRVHGDSMTSSIPARPSFLPNDIIIIDPEKKPITGDFIIFLIGKTKEPSFKQYVIDAGMLYLKPLNSQYPTITYDESEIDIRGVVIAHINVLI